LSDLIRDFNLSKESSELLASRLKEKNVLHSGTKIIFYRRREKDLLSFFTEDNNLVFCNDIGNLLKKIGLSEYNQSEWRLFTDCSLPHPF
jgi:DNA gyrase/topoisomerase IV subunit B